MNEKIQILVVEDNVADVELLRLALQDAEFDCELTVIDDGGEALAFIRQQDSGRLLPELIILDLNVPKSDGIEILRAIRESQAFKNLPVVITTSSSSPREMTQLHTLGIEKHFIKPHDLVEFMKLGPLLKQLLIDSRAARAVRD